MKTILAAAVALTFAASPLAAQTATQAPVTFAERQSSTEVLSTDFIGTPVLSKDGQQIGKVANLVFDQEGRIELAVIGMGGVLGIGEKDIAVPFDALKPETFKEKAAFSIDATKDQLTAAPTYETLDAKAMKERVAEWRTKAQQSWTDIKSRAAKAYEDAKQGVDQKQ
jgi:sporulation protein YlmC with PRC-barrel domain